MTLPDTTASGRDRRLVGFWRLADPKISITSLVCMIVGGTVAAADGALHWGWHAVLFCALFCMEVAKNAWGDVIDFDSGNDLAVAEEDRTDFSGGKRVLVDRLLTRGETWAIAFATGGLGVGLGALIVFAREPGVFWIGVVGLVLGWSYHGPPLKLAYRGLGELDVVLCYGPVLVLATVVIQTGRLDTDALWLSIPLGVLIAAFLWVNEFPDFLADRAAGKWNGVARLGRRRASRVLPLVYAVGFGVLVAGGTTVLPRATLLGLAAVPLAAYACVRVWQAPESFYRHAPVQPAALGCFVVYAVAVSAGYAIGR